MRHLTFWSGMLCLLLAACQPAERSLPTLMSLPLQSATTQAASSPPPAVVTVLSTAARSLAAVVLSETPTSTLTPTELPPLPSVAASETPPADALSSTLAALTRLPDTSPATRSACEGNLCLPTPILSPTVQSPVTLTPRSIAQIGPLITMTPQTVTPNTVVQPSATPTATAGAWYTQNHAMVDEPATLYDGPGTTYPAVGVLNPEVDVRVIERNRIGNWLHVRQSQNGETQVDGWVMVGALQMEKTLRFSQVPVNETLPDASMLQVRLQTTAPLYAAPVIPYISEAMREVYLRGQQSGLRSAAVTKVGDSVSANPLYLDLMSNDRAILGPYDYLADTLAYFGPSRRRESMAARKGMSSFSIFDPIMAGNACKADESPLVCELRLQKPSVAFIMFGPNDLRSMTVEEYTTQMSRLVETLLANGTIPVLTTFSADPSRRSWQPSVTFNLALIEIARTYDVPLMNFWLASRDLPKYGLEGDGVHLRNFGYNYLKFDAGLESRFGVSLQNLLALRTLEELRNTVMRP